MKRQISYINTILFPVCLILFSNCKKAHIPAKPTVEPPTISYMGGSRIAWDYSTLKKISNAGGYNGYARLIALKDGSLICTYESNGSILVVKSMDEGANWSAPVVVAAGGNGTNMAVPDILELRDGSILLCYNPRPYTISPERKFGIRTKKSYDKGLTWTDARLLYEADYRPENGCWEPSAIQLPNNEIQLFFANEGVYKQSGEQNISMLRSADNGLTWTTTPQIVSFRSGARDGMPVPLLLKNGNEIVYAIEDNGFSNFKPYIIRNTITENWATIVDAASPNRNYALQEPLADAIYAGAPYLRQLANGETILSYQGTEGRINNNLGVADMKVVIGNDEAKLFNRKSVPFVIPATKSALWNSVSVIDDNTVAAITSTNGYSTNGATEVWMIKGHIIANTTAGKETITIDGNLNEAGWKARFPVFVGHKSKTRTAARFSYDSKYLYVLTKVGDTHIVKTDSAEAGDGTLLFIHASGKTYPAIQRGIFKIFVSAGNKVVVKEGDNGKWTASSANKYIKSSTRTSSIGYAQEIAIPWTLLKRTSEANTVIGLNYGIVENTGNSTAAYTETLPNCTELEPPTWVTVTLK